MSTASNYIPLQYIPENPIKSPLGRVQVARGQTWRVAFGAPRWTPDWTGHRSTRLLWVPWSDGWLVNGLCCNQRDGWWRLVARSCQISSYFSIGFSFNIYIYILYNYVSVYVCINVFWGDCSHRMSNASAWFFFTFASSPCIFWVIEVAGFGGQVSSHHSEDPISGRTSGQRDARCRAAWRFWGYFGDF